MWRGLLFVVGVVGAMVAWGTTWAWYFSGFSLDSLLP